jgi:carboxyl-terminal processing protease
MDELSGSASEMFAGGMQSIGRVRVFGATSAGAVLPARMDRLPNEDVLYHAFGDFTTAGGIMLEGRGVIPDEPVPLMRPDVLAGRDASLDAAIRWIAASSAGTTGMDND